MHYSPTITLILACLIPVLARSEEPLRAYPAPAEVKASFVKMLDRPRIPLNVKASPPERQDGLLVEHLSFASEIKANGQEERVPVLIIRPEKAAKRLPSVIVLHGTGGTKESQRAWLVNLARRDIIGVAIDARYHGERSGGGRGADAYNAAIVRAWKSKPNEPREHPFYFDTVWDLWRTLDYLEARDDVDPKRLGMIGFSMGGIETWLAAAVDDRVRVAVPAIAVQSFRWSLENDRWQGRANSIRAAHEAAAKDLGEEKVNRAVCRALWEKVIPGILDRYDCPSMIRLFAGRPLLILNGENDPNCPLGGAELAFTAAREAFQRSGTEDRLKILVAKGVGHSVTASQQEAAMKWLEKWLAR